MILVTGGTGHVGSPLVKALVKQGARVRIISLDRNAKIKGAEIIYGDILNDEAVKKAMEGVDTVYHLAAIVDYGPSPKKLMYDVNVNGTKNILKYSEGKKLIYLSTTSVYGRKMKENPANENTPYNPDSYYGKTKEIAEKLVLDGSGIVLRSPVIYGPGFTAGFDVSLAQMQKGKMPIIGDGSNRIQWIHISDLIQALLLARDKGKPGEKYLVSGSDTKTQKELSEMTARYLGVEPPKKKVSAFLAYSMASYSSFSAKLKGKKPKLLPEHIARITSDRTFDISKAKRELGFSPKVGYEQGIKEIVNLYLRN